MLDDDAYTSPAPADGKALSAERALRSAIVHCVLKPGERLSEAGLCSEFALGRGAVRAALARLQASGFVSATARSGWVVTPVSAGEIREVVNARRHLEPMLATVVLGEPQRLQLQRLADMYAAIEARADQAFELQSTMRRCERDLFDALLGRLGMPVVAGWLADLWDRSWRLVQFFEGRGTVRLKPADRVGLVEALLRSDAEAARRHLVASVDQLETYLAGRFLESEAAVPEPAARKAGPATNAKKPKRLRQPRNRTDTRTI